MLWLGGLRLLYFFCAGCALFLAITLWWRTSFGSLSAVLRVLGPQSDARQSFPYAGAFMVIFLCATWGANTALLAGDIAEATAKNDAQITARYLYSYGVRGCKKGAAFSTEYGHVGACAERGIGLGPSTPMPMDFHPGDHVVMKGVANSYAFVLNSVEHDPTYAH
jgi:hypothetical protein